MSMAPTTEPQSTPSELGQRLFLLGVFVILLVEVVCTVANVGQWFTWSSCLLGIIASIGILYLGNWLYTGNTTALLVTRIWVVVQLALIIVGLAILLFDSSGESTFPRHVGVNATWMGLLKLVVYLGFAFLLFVPGYTLDFFSAQRGETRAPAITTASTPAAPIGEPADLATEHTRALEGLVAAMKVVGGVLLAVGALDILTGLLMLGQRPATSVVEVEAVGTASRTDLAGILSIVEGIALALWGAALSAPTKATQALLTASPRNMGFVINLFTSFLGTFKAYLLILVVLALVVICRVVFNAM
jgi:hypothetical protein